MTSTQEQIQAAEDEIVLIEVMLDSLPPRGHKERREALQRDLQNWRRLKGKLESRLLEEAGGVKREEGSEGGSASLGMEGGRRVKVEEDGGTLSVSGMQGVRVKQEPEEVGEVRSISGNGRSSMSKREPGSESEDDKPLPSLARVKADSQALRRVKTEPMEEDTSSSTLPTRSTTHHGEYRPQKRRRLGGGPSQLDDEIDEFMMGGSSSAGGRPKSTRELEDEEMARRLQEEFDRETDQAAQEEREIQERLRQFEADAEMARRLQEEFEQHQPQNIIDLTGDEELARRLQEELNAENGDDDVVLMEREEAPPAPVPALVHVPQDLIDTGVSVTQMQDANAFPLTRPTADQPQATWTPWNAQQPPHLPPYPILPSVKREQTDVDGIGRWNQPNMNAGPSAPGQPNEVRVKQEPFDTPNRWRNQGMPGAYPGFRAAREIKAEQDDASDVEKYFDIGFPRIAPYVPPALGGPSTPQPYMKLESTPPAFGNDDDRMELPEEPLSTKESEQELKNLLQNVQLHEDVTPPERRLPTPADMTVQLLEHQKLGLEWMLKMERGNNKGGILADDMGMGKTVQSIATMVSNRADSKNRSTLIVAPVSLIYQWQAEVKEKVKPGKLSVHIYHGGQRTKSLVILSNYDVVLTSYHTLAAEWPETDKKGKGKKRKSFPGTVNRTELEQMADAEYEEIMAEEEDPKEAIKRAGLLFRMKWHRVILDEAHSIKNKSTKAARACSHLESQYRWCLTGTPIQNNIGDLFSLIHFLRIRPYCDWTKFRMRIQQPFQRGRHKRALERVTALLKAISLRRTKTSYLDGKPIVELPPRNVNMDHADFTAAERDFYQHLEQKMQLKFNAYVKAGTVMKNYTNILVLLLRLRQACCHPSLVSKDFEKAAPEDVENAAVDVNDHVTNVLNELKPEIKSRLLEEDLRAMECPVCLDTITDGVILNTCGHVYCQECLTAHSNANPNLDARKTCPTCRGEIDLGSTIPIAKFLSHFAAEVATEKVKVKQEEDGGNGKGKGKGAADLDDDDLLEDMKLDPHEDWITSTKIDRMMAVLQDTRKNHPGEKTIVFSQFTGMLDMCEVPLKRNGYSFERYDGSMSAVDRDIAVRRLATRNDTTVLLVSMKCGSLGLNLTCANHVILLDPWWNPAVENQSIDRVHRFGQQKNVTVHRIVINHTVEERIMDLQKKKQAIADAALGEGEGAAGLGRGRLNMADLMHLFNVDAEDD
ncbi:hypothetical protein HDV00_009665 [Rhizophlyctis rosea]|nr:hypothetical protein HDV00_009665 [Rhizophlyctis rosea]